MSKLQKNPSYCIALDYYDETQKPKDLKDESDSNIETRMKQIEISLTSLNAEKEKLRLELLARERRKYRSKVGHFYTYDGDLVFVYEFRMNDISFCSIRITIGSGRYRIRKWVFYEQDLHGLESVNISEYNIDKNIK